MRPAMRRADRAVSEELARQFLAESEYLTLSMTDPDGLPYGVALSFAVMDGALYFHSAKEGYKCTCIGSGAPCGVEELLAGIGVKIPALRAPPIWSARAPVVPWEVWSQGHRRP